MQCVKTFPGQREHEKFDELVDRLYPEDSYRMLLGFDPIPDFLEGCYSIISNDAVVARFTLYQTPDLVYKSKRALSIGSYECVEDEMIATYTLNTAASIAGELGAEVLIGPMEGATWNNYRFTEDFDQHPPFFMEPIHKSYYPDQFLSNEFEKIAHYTSNIDRNLAYSSKELEALEKEFHQQGFKLRTISMNDFTEELEKIAQFCDAAFKDNFLFTPIRKETFIEKYRSQRDKINPLFTLIAENNAGEMAGIFFPIHDYMDPSGKRFILKTMARRKDIGFPKMVRFLGQKTIKTAIELGYEEVIHAFVHDTNVSRKISAEFRGQPYKTHALYARYL